MFNTFLYKIISNSIEPFWNQNTHEFYSSITPLLPEPLINSSNTESTVINSVLTINSLTQFTNQTNLKTVFLDKYNIFHSKKQCSVSGFTKKQDEKKNGKNTSNLETPKVPQTKLYF